MQEQFDIVGFGICAVDFVGLVSHYPVAGEKVAIEAFSKQGGGNTGTALTTAARLGAKTAYIGKFGSDEYSQFLLDEFYNEGVDIRNVIIEQGAQPHISFIHVERGTGERRISRYWNGFKIAAEDLNRAVIQKSKILFLDHYFTEAGLAAANWIKANGGMVVVDAERPVPEFEPILTLADYIIAARKYAEAETGVSDPQKAAQILQEEFGNVVVVTAGENGSFCQTPEQSLYQAAYSVNLVDTTGAGDVYHGAFMVGLLENWPLQKILEFSSAVAAMKCRGLGGRASIPTRKEVIEFLKQKGTQKYLP